MILIKDLGMKFATPNSKKAVRFGIYECPICNTHFECITKSVKSGNTTKCNVCARKLAGIKNRKFDTEYPKLYNKFLRERLNSNLSEYFLNYENFKLEVLTLGWEEGKILIRIDNTRVYDKGNIKVSDTREPKIDIKPLDLSCIPNSVRELTPRRFGLNQDLCRIIEYRCTKCGSLFERIFRKSKEVCLCNECINESKSLSFEVGDYIGNYGIIYKGKSNLGNSYSIMTCGACGKDFEAKHSNYITDAIKSCGCNSGISIMEKELSDFIKSLEVHTILRDRSLIKPKELDIIIPDYKLAIEFNGLYWHSELQGKDKNYHLDKYKECMNQGYKLIHIFEHQWLYKKEIVKDIIKKQLNIVNTKIYARKCTIRLVNTQDAKVFLDTNHLQGYCTSTYKIGLYYDNTLVSIMTFGTNRYSKNTKWELIRFANKLGVNVIGGASKILTYFRNNYEGSIVSYCDISIFSGKLYSQLGFKLSHYTKPNYFYFDSMCKTYSRVIFQKHKLKDKLANFNPSLTEWENMVNNNYNRYWDCGNAVYILT